MNATIAADTALWADTLARTRRELAELPVAEHLWLAAQVVRIAALQRDLDRLFRAGDGPAVCAACRGGCCSRAKHHATLTNLLGYLLHHEEPPPPDFSRPCPFLGPAGCGLPVERRPFNCIIFFCEALDERLTDQQRAELTRIEHDLRAGYDAIAARCPGASLRGLLIAAARLGDRPLLASS
jgi:hypothetical protein